MVAANEKQIMLCSNISITLNIPFDLSNATIQSADKFIDKHLEEFNIKNRKNRGISSNPGNFEYPITL